MMKYPNPNELQSIDITDIPAYIHLEEKGLSIQTFFETNKLLGFDCLYRTTTLLLDDSTISYGWIFPPCDYIPNGIKKFIDEYNNNRDKTRRYKLTCDLYSSISYLQPFDNKFSNKRIAKLLAIYAFNNN